MPVAMKCSMTLYRGLALELLIIKRVLIIFTSWKYSCHSIFHQSDGKPDNATDSSPLHHAPTQDEELKVCG